MPVLLGTIIIQGLVSPPPLSWLVNFEPEFVLQMPRVHGTEDKEVNLSRGAGPEYGLFI